MIAQDFFGDLKWIKFAAELFSPRGGHTTEEIVCMHGVISAPSILHSV